MRRLLLLVLVFCLPAIAQDHGKKPKTERKANGTEVVSGEAIVKYKEKPDLGKLLKRIHGATSIDVLMGNTVKVKFENRSVEDVIKDIKKHEGVVYVQPNYYYPGKTPAVPPDDPYLWAPFNLDKQWFLYNDGNPIYIPQRGDNVSGNYDSNVFPAWGVTTGSSDIIVASFDTGYEYTHPDWLPESVWSAPSSYTMNLGGHTFNCAAGTHGIDLRDMNCDPWYPGGASDFHGTATSGVIMANTDNGYGVAGLCKGCVLFPVVACCTAAITTTVFAEAFNYLRIMKTEVFPQQLKNLKVVNISLGYPMWNYDVDVYLFDAVQALSDAGVVMVVAAGNENDDPCDGASISAPQYFTLYPTPVANIINVVAIDPDGKRSVFSDFGSTCTHLGAPGVQVVSTNITTYQDPKHRTIGRFSGTSLSAPIVTGGIALLQSACPFLTAEQLKDYVLTTVRPDPYLSGITTTGGVLDINAAIRKCVAGRKITKVRF